MKIIVNGCFDRFHEGHEYLIRYADHMAGLYGKVFILMNSDNSVRELKLRDPLPFETRKESIQEHIQNKYPHRWKVYSIFEFETEQELYRLIDGIQPDIILKGNDRPDIREIVGSDKWPVCIIPRLKDKNGNDISTTRIIDEEVNARG